MQLVVTEYGLRIGKVGERISVSRDGKSIHEVPIIDLENVIIAVEGASITVAAIAALVQAGIPISFMDNSGRVWGKLISPEDFGDADLRFRQYSAVSDGRGIALAKAFLNGKIRNQAANIRYFAKSRKDSYPELYASLAEAASTVESCLAAIESVSGTDLNSVRGTLLAAEGRAASVYWNAVKSFLPPALEFNGRVRRGALDPANIAINYGYGILYSRVWTCVLAAGLDPFQGFIHCYRENKPTLAFDFIEEFRQFVVDRPVISWLNKGGMPEIETDGKLSKPSRDRIAGLVLKRLVSTADHEGRRTRMQDIIQSEAYEIVRFLKGKGEHTPFIGAW